MDYIGSGYCSSTRYQVSILLLQEQRADQCFLCVLTIYIHADPFPNYIAPLFAASPALHSTAASPAFPAFPTAYFVLLIPSFLF